VNMMSQSQSTKVFRFKSEDFHFSLNVSLGDILQLNAKGKRILGMKTFPKIKEAVCSSP